MYEKAIAELCKSHLLTHLNDYLNRVDGADTLRPQMPKSIDISSVVGGVMNARTLPKYAIDVQTKEFSEQTGESLYTYNYGGQITGLVGGKSAQEVDDHAKLHKAACELFVNEHLYAQGWGTNPGFTLFAFGFSLTDFSGAIQLEKDPSKPYWICAFQLRTEWLVSEDQPTQHA